MNTATCIAGDIKRPLIYRATAQWFVGMDKQPEQGAPLRERAFQAIEEIRKFTPAWGKARLHGMIPGRARLVHLAST